MVRSISYLLLTFGTVCFVACAQKPATLVASACETLSKETVAQVQGESVIEVKASPWSGSGTSVSQCFYKLPTFSKSINFEVTQGTQEAIDAYWNKRFRDRSMSEEEEEELEREKKEGKKETSAAKPSGPQAVSGLGDDAFWTVSQISGSLFIRRGSAVYRINLGGADDPAVKLEKAKALADSFLNKKD